MGTNSGNIGYCHKVGSTHAVLIEWDGNKVISVDCEHETCGYADRCKLYQQYPVGYVQSPKMSLTSENP